MALDTKRKDVKMNNTSPETGKPRASDTIILQLNKPLLVHTVVSIENSSS